MCFWGYKIMAKTTGITALQKIQDAKTEQLRLEVAERDKQDMRFQLDRLAVYYVEMAAR